MKFFIAMISFVLLASGSSALEINGSAYRSGNWSGAAYTHNDTMKWSHCVMSGSFRNGWDLSFSLTDSYEVGVFLTNREQPVFEGQKEFELRTKVDRFGAMYGSATPIDDYTVGIWFTDLDEALRQFKKGKVLSVSSRIIEEEFNLTGTFKALDSTYSCASTYQDYQDANVTSRNAPEEAAWIPTGNDTAAMYQLATLLITDFKFQDFRFVTEANEINSGPIQFRANNDAIWGIVSVGREKGDIDLNTVMAEDVSSLTTKWCDDGSIALVNSSTTIEGAPTKSLRAMCDSPSTPFTAYMTKQVVSEVLVETVIFDYEQQTFTGSHKDNVAENIGFITANFVNIK